jgi:predicted nucleic acid-binding protein
MKKIYLDVCTLCRPFDNQSMMRIRLETDAYYLILKSIQDRTFEIIVSPVHFKEIEAIDDIYERIELTVLLNRYGKKPSFQLNEIKRRTEDLHSLNFGVADAAHVAFAETSADYLITCDDKLLKKVRKLKDINMEAVNPVNFCTKENLR